MTRILGTDLRTGMTLQALQGFTYQVGIVRTDVWGTTYQCVQVLSDGTIGNVHNRFCPNGETVAIVSL